MKHFLICSALLISGPASFGMEAELEFFEKKVRPLLVTHCVGCHGEKKQQGGLRLDSREAALKGGDTGPAFVAKEPEKSLIVQAVNYLGDNKMPPKGKLSDEDISTLNQWVKNGAAWPAGGAAAGNGPKPFDLKERAKHWSFQPVKKVSVPVVNGPGFISTPVDSFILEKLSRQGLKPAAKADKRTLLRRVTLDLTGLPPTAEEIDQFLKDESPLAWERVIDRLLASKSYGERYARHWLDLVRYAETLGHEFDFELFEAWRYRDYVIRALNADVPYDQFAREHIAGDLLPKPRTNPIDSSNESVQGTGFWFLGEAKHSPVDVREDQADRMDNEIDVFAKTFLGLTVSCARCHDHKFDAISTKDYYSLFGILSSSRHDKAFIDSPEQRAKWLSPLKQTTHDLEAKAIARTSAALGKQLAEKGITGFLGGSPTWAEIVALAGMTPEQFNQKIPAVRKKFERQEAALAAWAKQTNALPLPRTGWLMSGEAFSTNIPKATMAEDGKITGIPLPAIATNTLSPKLTGSLRSPTFVIDRDFILYRVPGNDVRVNLIIDNYQLIQDPIYGGLRFGAAGDENRWHVQNVKRWKGHRAYVELLDDGNGRASLLDVIQADQPNTPPEGPVKLLQETVGAETPEQFANELTKRVSEALEKWNGVESLTPDQSRLLNLLLGASANTPTITEEEKKLRLLFREQEKALPPARRALAIVDGTGLNERVFIRGSHKNPGEEVPRHLLEAIDPTPFKNGSGRLELADKLTDGTNPLTARVLVNRIWKHHFGEGIVRSPDDFGYQGQRPTHPELLDWLAGWFVENGWSVKKLHKLILMSGTYQQASIADQKEDAADPKNELFHKMPVRRLEAEAIRDSLLAISGRLDPAMEGPPVPTHLTAFMLGRGRPGGSGPLDGAGRRSIYLQVRRNFMNPFFMAFDYPVPFTTIGRRSSSNVPAQALAMLNNPLVNQQTELWAKRIIAVKEATTEDRIARMYVMAFGRPATAEELVDGKAFVEAQLAEYGVGQEAKAWTDFAHVLVNLKEFIYVR
ncbi:PSD1 and planctomycete cytochrome C domain-containing protein [Zavarzinella formosa]|uniref:PSD1 and planctomycete cytochrome C domain-containing protein n=1 Tax=Zavarzinella formosa TaxID=360055 RepID=UPI00031E34FC|nr:PSD1 and planctomycete cytochrome C domain-containing protein [Zavarzinella formosa]